ncbi:uncharacterized protein [Leptinotarsa decemlineata]|uniref:uncharacterized protein n=1 Tax=Leptinotarsa decemlineata TaxID=7539 RepID=UPI003D30BE90
MEKAISGFNSSGIHPFNPNKFTKEDFEAASQYLPPVSDDLDSTNQPHPGPTSNVPIIPQSCPKRNSKEISALAKDEVGISELSPLPSYSGKGKTRKCTKGKSEILTATPMKLILEEEQQRRNKMNFAREGKGKNIKAKVPLRKKNILRNMQLDSDTSEDNEIDKKNIVDDDELDDVYVDSNEKNLCLLVKISEKMGKFGGDVCRTLPLTMNATFAVKYPLQKGTLLANFNLVSEISLMFLLNI